MKINFNGFKLLFLLFSLSKIKEKNIPLHSMVLIDKNETSGRSHLVASTEAELHEFASGIKCSRFENKRGKFKPHYDLKGDEFERAIEAGAVLVSSKTIIRFLNEHYGKGLDRKKMKKMVFLADLIRYQFEGEKGFSEKRIAEIEKLGDESEKVYDQYSDEGEALAQHMGMMFMIKKIFS
jgi:hypothetical protein